MSPCHSGGRNVQEVGQTRAGKAAYRQQPTGGDPEHRTLTVRRSPGCASLILRQGRAHPITRCLSPPMGLPLPLLSTSCPHLEVRPLQGRRLTAVSLCRILPPSNLPVVVHAIYPTRLFVLRSLPPFGQTRRDDIRTPA